MHLIFYARGANHAFELWKTFMQGQFFKWKRRNLVTDKDEDILVQGSLRPSVLGAFEYVFPEEALPDVLAMVSDMNSKVEAEQGFLPQTKLKFLRTIFGCKKIPKEIMEEAKKIPNSIIINNSNRGLSSCVVFGVSIHIIGIKKDKRRDFDFSLTGEGKYNQEEL